MKTIKTLFTFCLFSLFFTTNQTKAQGIDFGVKGGVGFYNLMMDQPENPEISPGINLAGVMRVPLYQDLFYFQPELGYARKGTSFSLEGQNFAFDFDYIEMPLLISIGKPNMSFVEVGGYVNYLINTNVSQPTTLNGDDLNSISTSDFKGLDYGIAFGLNFNFSNYFIGARYNYGLEDISRSSVNNVFGQRARNRGLQVYLMYMF